MNNHPLPTNFSVVGPPMEIVISKDHHFAVQPIVNSDGKEFVQISIKYKFFSHSFILSMDNWDAITHLVDMAFKRDIPKGD